MTWGEIKIITLQKMFAKDEPIGTKNLSSLVNDDDCKVYISNMPAVANEAIQRLSRYCQNKYQYNEQEKAYEKIKVDKITADTKDDYELQLPESACVLMPLYMASQLYKDDDISQATAYRNEFEVGLADLDTEIENQHYVDMVMEV